MCIMLIHARKRSPCACNILLQTTYSNKFRKEIVCKSQQEKSAFTKWCRTRFLLGSTTNPQNVPVRGRRATAKRCTSITLPTSTTRRQLAHSSSLHTSSYLKSQKRLSYSNTAWLLSFFPYLLLPCSNSDQHERRDIGYDTRQKKSGVVTPTSNIKKTTDEKADQYDGCHAVFVPQRLPRTLQVDRCPTARYSQSIKNSTVP